MYVVESSSDVVVYYHGNAGYACDRSSIKETFEKTGLSVIFVEYTGYSNDDKKPSMKVILKDVENVHDYVKKFRNVTVYGQSIGSGAASYQASLGGVDKLMLVTSFTSFADVGQSKYFMYPVKLMITENYDNVKWLKDYKVNVLIIHGDRDFIIPSKHSLRLYERLKTEKKDYVLIQGKGHTYIWDSE